MIGSSSHSAAASSDHPFPDWRRMVSTSTPTRPEPDLTITSRHYHPASPPPGDPPFLLSAAGSPASRLQRRCSANFALQLLPLRLPIGEPLRGSFLPIRAIGSGPTWAPAHGSSSRRLSRHSVS